MVETVGKNFIGQEFEQGWGRCHTCRVRVEAKITDGLPILKIYPPYLNRYYPSQHVGRPVEAIGIGRGPLADEVYGHHRDKQNEGGPHNEFNIVLPDPPGAYILLATTSSVDPSEIAFIVDSLPSTIATPHNSTLFDGSDNDTEYDGLCRLAEIDWQAVSRLCDRRNGLLY